MLDRVWWLWQMQDPENRVGAIPGGAAMGMSHPGMGGMGMKGRWALKDEIVDLGWIAGPTPLTDLTDQLGGNGGQFCYIYV